MLHVLVHTNNILYEVFVQFYGYTHGVFIVSRRAIFDLEALFHPTYIISVTFFN